MLTSYFIKKNSNDDKNNEEVFRNVINIISLFHLKNLKYLNNRRINHIRILCMN